MQSLFEQEAAFGWVDPFADEEQGDSTMPTTRQSAFSSMDEEQPHQQQPQPMDEESAYEEGEGEEDEGDAVFTERVTDILRRQSMRETQQSTSPSLDRQQDQQQASFPSGEAGPFTSAELGELSLLCTQQAAPPASGTGEEKRGFAGVDGDLLTSLVLLLHQHVQAASTLDLFKEAGKVLKEESREALHEWLKDDSKTHAQTIRGGLEAANIILHIAVTKGADRRAVNEDALEAILTLYRLHMREHSIPTINETGHSSFQSDKENMESEAQSPPRKKRRTSSKSSGSTHRLSKELGKLYKLVGSTFNLYFVLMERMELLVESMLLEDHQVLLITNSSMQAFEIDCHGTKDNFASHGRQIQLTSISIISSAFQRYPQHRDSILEELYPILLKLPTAKRSLRAFRVRYASAASSSLTKLNAMVIRSSIDPGMAANHSIQMVTGLILALVQSCVVRPTYAETVAISEDEEPPPFPQFATGLKDCQRIAMVLVDQLLRRCTRSKYGGGTVEFRSFMVSFVHDLLSVILIPEYPAAEMIIFTLMQRLRHDITQASEAGPSKGSAGVGTENTYLTFAFDLVGKVCSTEATLIRLGREYPIEVGRERVINKGEDIIDCYCGNKSDDLFTLSCDDCNHYSHGPCVGLMKEEASPEDEWLCDACRLARIAKREQRVKFCRDTSFMDSTYTMRHAFLSSIAHRTGVENLEPAVQFHFARWLDELQTKLTDSAKSSPVQKPTKKLLEELVNQWDSIEAYGELLTDEGYNRMLLALFTQSSPMALSFKHQINFVLKMMADMRSSHIRKLSLKTIEKVAESDDRLMLVPAITRTVSSRLVDTTISVREAALSFVGSYVVQFPKVATAFHPSLIMCLGDSGLSVRKRAIKCFQEILTTNPHYRGRSEACDAMLKRAAFRKEEDTVRDLVHSLFTKIFFQDADQIVAGPHASPRKAPPSPMGSPVATPVSPSQHLLYAGSTVKRGQLAALMMMEIVRTAGTGDHLEKFLRRVFDTNLDEDRGRRRKSRGEVSRQHIDRLIEALFEILLRLDESRAERGDTIGQDIAATLRTIEILSGTEPFVVLSHLDTILPYLKADNGVAMNDEAQIVSACCDIISRIAPAFGENDLKRFGSSVAKDLKQITFSFNAGPMNSAIRTLSAIAHHQSSSNDSYETVLLNIAQTFYSYLLRHIGTPDFSQEKEKIRNNLHRALTVLGFICQHRDRHLGSMADEQEFSLPEEDAAPPTEITFDNFTVASYQVISEFLKKNDNPTKCAALRALGNCFLNEPRLLFALEQVGLVDDIMSPKAPAELQLEALDVWKKILESEEKRIDAGHAKEKMDRDASITVTKRISGDQDSDSNLFGGVLTNHAGRLFEMVYSKDAPMRFSALELLGLLLRQGLVNPMEAIPHLLALQGDVDNDTIRSLALEYLMAESEKRPDMIRQRVRAGVKHSFTFQRTIYPQRHAVSAVFSAGDRVECIFGKVFIECVAKIRKQRHGLFASLLGLFEWKAISGQKGHAKGGQRTSPTRGRTGADLSLLSFASQILAHLPYLSADSPLFIINKLTAICALQGDQILERFASLLPRTQNFDEDDTGEDEDYLERAAKSKFPGRTKAAQPLTDGNYDLRSFAKQCQTSVSFTLLMRLKAYLQKVYRLSDLRCLEYDPKGKEKISDRSVHRIENPPPFDSSLPAGLANSSAAPDVDSLIRQYAEFRRSFRCEMASSTKAEEERVESQTRHDDEASDDSDDAEDI